MKNAKRNVIGDVEFVRALLDDPSIRGMEAHDSSPRSCPIMEIVSVMEQVTGKVAAVEIPDAGGAYEIAPSCTAPIVERLGMKFDSRHDSAVIGKSYGAHRAGPRG